MYDKALILSVGSSNVHKGAISDMEYIRSEFYNNISTVLDNLNVDSTIQKANKSDIINSRLDYEDDILYIVWHSTENRDNVINMKNSHLFGYFYLDKTGYAGWSEMANNPELFVESQKVDIEEAEDFFYSVRNYILSNNRTIHYTDCMIDFDSSMDYILFVMQKPMDTVSILSRIDTYSMVHMINRVFKDSSINFVFKKHPSDNNSTPWLDCMVKNNSNFYRTFANIHDVISDSVGVVTVNSGVGFESLLHMKPVFTAGKTDYEWVTNNIYNIRDIENIPDRLCVNRGRVMKFLYYFLDKYNVRYDDMDSIQDRISNLVCNTPEEKVK